MTPSIEFLGAVGTVTGSRYLVHTPVGSILVDSGWTSLDPKLGEELPLA